MLVEWPILFLGAGIVLIAFYIASIAGFGSSALTVSFLSLIIDVKLVVPVLVVLSFVFNLVLIGHSYRHADWKSLIPLIIGNVIGTGVGVYFFKQIDSGLLVQILGVGVIAFAWDLAIKKNWRELPFKSITGVIVGAISGLTEIMFSISSPPIVFHLANFIREKQVLRGTIVTFFAIASTIGIISLTIGGVMNMDILTMSTAFTPSAVLGTWLGHRTSLRTNEKLYRIVVSAILIISGLLLIFS